MEGTVTGLNLAVILLKGGFLLYLAAAGVQDYRYRRIRTGVFWGFGIAGGVLRAAVLILECSLGEQAAGSGWMQAGNAMADIGAAMAVGGFLLIAAYVTREAVGKGDGWFFAVSGIYLGFWRNLALLWGSLMLCLITGGVIAALLKRRDRRIPMRRLCLPFLTLAVPVGLGVLLI